MTTASDIVTPRLRLVLIPEAVMRALLAGDRDAAVGIAPFVAPPWWPEEHDLQMLRYRMADLARDATCGDWLVRAMVPLAGGEIIGHIGFHGPPEDGVAEVGYTVFEPHRRKGYAAEAFEGMLGWAGKQGVTRFRLSIAPDNEPSLAIARRFQFVQTGEQMDEIDGLELVFELERPV